VGKHERQLVSQWYTEDGSHDALTPCPRTGRRSGHPHLLWAGADLQDAYITARHRTADLVPLAQARVPVGFSTVPGEALTLTSTGGPGMERWKGPSVVGRPRPPGVPSAGHRAAPARPAGSRNTVHNTSPYSLVIRWPPETCWCVRVGNSAISTRRAAEAVRNSWSWYQAARRANHYLPSATA